MELIVVLSSYMINEVIACRSGSLIIEIPTGALSSTCDSL